MCRTEQTTTQEVAPVDHCMVVVQNTFVNVVEASGPTAGSLSLLRQVRSDSCLCALGSKGGQWADMTEESTEADVLELAALSPGGAWHPRSHLRSCSRRSASPSATTASREEGDEEKTHGVEDSSSTSDAVQEEASDSASPEEGSEVETREVQVASEDERLQHENWPKCKADAMAEDNDRLARENAALQEQVRQMQLLRDAAPTPIAVMDWSQQAGNGFAVDQGCMYSPMWMPVVYQQQAWSSSSEQDDQRTTVMLRNLPNNYTRAMLVELLESNGFGGTYNFLYLPIDFKTQAALGYAFIDLASPGLVPAFWSAFGGFSAWCVPSRKQCFVSWCEPNQGLEAHIERYRNSPVMHESVPDEYRPMLLQDGLRVPFPPPTKAIRAPRVRDCRRDVRC